MTAKGRFATILIVLTVFGCKGPLQTSAASAAEGLSGSSSGDGANGAPSSGGGTRVEYITDPTMDNMNAISVTIPANWHFQGVLMQSGDCGSGTFAVFRAKSPDGQSMVERLPALGWTWGSGSAAASRPKDCLPLSGPMSAQDYLKYLAQTMHVQYVSDVPVRAEALEKLKQSEAQARAYYPGGNGGNGGISSSMKQELASAAVSFKNGTLAMKGELRTNVTCTENNWPGMRSGVRGIPDRAPSTTDKCSAGVTFFSAPENQLAGLIHAWDSQGMGGKAQDQWIDAWVQRNKEHTRQIVAGMAARSEASLAAQRQQFAHSQAVQQQMHEEFLDTMQRGTDISMANAQASTNARTTAASDWVDYALDQKTVLDTNTGVIYKTGNQITPGGAAVQVHGNGTPY